MADLDRARAAKRELAAELARRRVAGAVGLERHGEGGEDYVLTVRVTDAAAGGRVPAEVMGVPVVTVVVGQVRPQSG